ncbi:MAG: hypothetical protein MZV70_72720 [Desulfobacterales bacterium]|nr:hypothetical protein [Desulfobacterales bacterium]
MTPAQSMYHVILPQAVKTILPPVGNEFVALLKDSSLVSILAVADLLRRGREYASQSFAYFETYTMVALVYLIDHPVLLEAHQHHGGKDQCRMTAAARWWR